MQKLLQIRSDPSRKLGNVCQEVFNQLYCNLLSFFIVLGSKISNLNDSVHVLWPIDNIFQRYSALISASYYKPIYKAQLSPLLPHSCSLFPSLQESRAEAVFE